MNARDAYLTFQSDIGMDEVVLTQPWIRKEPIGRSGITEKVRGPVAAEIAHGPEFFQAVAKALKESSPGGNKESVPVKTVVDAPSLPEFKDLDAYWKFVTAEYSRWFPATKSSDWVFAEGVPHPPLALVELSPEPAPSPRVFGGEAGDLLDKMMKAIHLHRERTYLTSVMKTPASGRGWPRKDIARMLPCLFQELRLASCSVVLLLGEACAQSVLRTGSGLETLRQKPFESHGLVFAVSYHPSDLMRDESLKRNAWEDLKWLRPRLASGA